VRKNRNQSCRQLIAKEDHLIAAPHDIHEHIIKVIMERSFHLNEKYQENISKLGLKQEKAMAVTNKDFQVCFHFTLLVKLSPQWNQIGSPSNDEGVLLLHGANFLTSKKVIPALKVDVVVAANEIQIFLQAYNVKMPVSQYTQFGISRRISSDFANKGIDVITDQHIKNQWCYILPSLKMGKVMEVRREMPGYANFNDYSELKSFWKDSYGYQLPSRNDYYYGVYFMNMGRTLSYPRSCVLSKKPTIWPCTDNIAKHTSHFIKDVNMKFAKVCSQELNFMPKSAVLPRTLDSDGNSSQFSNSLLDSGN